MYFDHRLTVAAFAALAVLRAPVMAQTGNLVPNGRFDLADGVIGWVVASPENSSMTFDASADLNDCLGSGVALGTNNSSSDAGSAQYRVCLGAVSPDESFRMSGEFRFESSAVSGRANLTLRFFSSANCEGTLTSTGFAGYAQSATAGWQHLEAGPVTPAPTAQSAALVVFLTKTFGADPAVSVQFDEIRVTRIEWIFAEDFEVGETCRWSLVAP